MAKIVLTGTAYAGKSALLREFERKGYQVCPEAETPLVQRLNEELGAQQAKRWILENYTQFKHMVGEIQREINSQPTHGKPAFYDRSAICYIAYCHLRNAQVPQILLDVASHTEPDCVFFLDRLTQFSERREKGRFMSEAEAGRLAKLIEHEYTKRGIELIRVPEFSTNKYVNLSQRTEYIETILHEQQVSSRTG